MKLNQLLLGVIAIVTVFAGRAYGTELSVTATNMAPGTWAQLKSPGNFFVQVGDTDTTLHFMGQGMWDSTRKQVVFLGAPHGGNTKLHIYDDKTDSWIEGAQVPGFPASLGHGYNHNAIDLSGRVLGFLSIRSANSDLDFWEYHLDTQNYIQKGRSQNDGDVAHALVYFPERSRWYVADGTYGKLREYNRTTDTWSVIDQNMACYGPASGGYQHQFATYHSGKRLIGFGGGDTFGGALSTSWCTLDATGTVVVRPTAPHVLRIPEGGRNTTGALITSDPVSGDLITLTQTGSHYRFDFGQNKWFAINDSATRPGFFNQTSGNNVTSSFVVPIDTYGVIMYGKYNGDNTQVWLYKHASGGGTPPPPPSEDTTPPSPPHGLKAVPISSSRISPSWNASAENNKSTSYQITKANIPNTIFSTLSFRDTGLTSSTNYTYAMKAFDSAGNHSSASSPSQAETRATSAPPLSTPSGSSMEFNPILDILKRGWS